MSDKIKNNFREKPLRSKIGKFGHNSQPLTFSYSSCAVIFIFRTLAEKCVYLADSLKPDDVDILTGTATQYATITNSNQTITVDGTAAREYFMIAIYD